MATIVFVLLTTLPSHLITFSFFWNFPWRSKKRAFFLICCNVFLKMLSVTLLPPEGNIRGVEWLFSVIGFTIYFFSLRISWGKALFSFVMVVDYLSIVRGLSVFFSIRLFHSSAQSWASCLLCILFYAVSLPWMLQLFRRTAHTIFETEAPAFWNTAWLVPALVTAVILLFTNTYDDTSSGSWHFLFARVALLICIPVIYALMLHSVLAMRHQAVLEEQARQNEQILAFQRTQFTRLQEHMEEIRRARHDLRQHQNVIQSFLDSEDQEMLRSYLLTQTAAQPAERFKCYCENYAINMLLNYYAGHMIEDGIDLEIQVNLPEQTAVPTSDLCVALGNLLENAWEACAGQPEPFVRVCASRTDAKAITLVVDNTAPVSPNQQPDGTFRSSKHVGTGIGTQSVRYIARQHGGFAQFHWEDGVFYASVFFNPSSIDAKSP